MSETGVERARPRAGRPGLAAARPASSCPTPSAASSPLGSTRSSPTSVGCSKTPRSSAAAARSMALALMTRRRRGHRRRRRGRRPRAEGPARPRRRACWTFRSDLVREVAYDMLTKTDRAQRHLGVATWMDEHIGDHLGEVDRIAHHYATAALLVIELGGLDSIEVEPLVAKAADWLQRGDQERRARRAVDQRRVASPPRASSWATSRRRAALPLPPRHARPPWPSTTSSSPGADPTPPQASARGRRGRRRAARRLARARRPRAEGGRARPVADGTSSGASPRTELGNDSRASGRGPAPARDGRDVRGQHRRRRHGRSPGAGDLPRASATGAGEAWCQQNLAWIVVHHRATSRRPRPGPSGSIEAFAKIGDTGGLGWAHRPAGVRALPAGHSEEAESHGEG